MEVISINEVDTYVNNTKFEIAQLVDVDNAVIFSKTVGNNLPLTGTLVDSSPCIDPRGRHPSQRFYPTEVRLVQDPICEVDPVVGTSVDDRYEKAGL